MATARTTNKNNTLDRGKPTKWRPSIGLVLFTLNLVVVILPIAGFQVMRIYESSLIRQTENALSSQSAFIAATFRAEVEKMEVGKDTLQSRSFPLPQELWAQYDRDLTPWKPHIAALDLANDTVLPRVNREKPNKDIGSAAWQKTIGQHLNPILIDAQGTTLSAMRVLDTQGLVIASTDDDVGFSYAHLEEVQEARKGEIHAVLRSRGRDLLQMPLTSISRNSAVRVYLTAPIVSNKRIIGIVLLWRTPPNVVQALYGKRHALLYAIVGLLGLVLLISLFTSYTIRRPVQRVEKQALAALKGHPSGFSMIEHPTTREVASLSREVANMANTLDQRATYLQDLAARISHEFKSPLTALAGTIELLQDGEVSMPPAQKQRFLDNMGGDVDRLSTLVSSLMELARADTKSNEPQNEETCNLADLCQELARIHHERGRHISFEDLRPKAADFQVPRESLTSILTNLVDNAFLHGGKEVDDLKIELKLRSTKTAIIISVQDNGKGISTNNFEKVRQPFFTTARASGGTGLGLSVVDSLVRAMGGTFDLKSDQDTVTGTTALVTIPLSL